MTSIKNKKLKTLITYLMLLLGTIILSFSLECFLIPNTILDGGITGVSIIVMKLTNMPLWLAIVLLNIPFFYLGYKNLGKDFIKRSIFALVSFSLFLSFFEIVKPFTEEMLLATVFGGALCGLGTGIIIKFGGCTDGSESVAIIISKKTGFSIGQIVLFENLIIYTVAGFIFGFDRAMYSLLTYIITYKIIDFVSIGIEQAKAALIITEKGTDLSNEIYEKLGRTTTKIKGKGLISGEKEILYCVLSRLEIFELRHIVENMDSSAFVTITEVSDIIGNNIKSNNKLKSK